MKRKKNLKRALKNTHKKFSKTYEQLAAYDKVLAYIESTFRVEDGPGGSQQVIYTRDPIQLYNRIMEMREKAR